ncbi:nmrA family protein [Neofusicoccum parvum]|uniref:NmrA family protein n=1 Tax=Neofusicoccum parvum TaxID=310453 RepID=A0ACB5SJ95_9PEZI|nr:nmrA family protein [Neofusicoccum parvum]
MLFDGMYVPQEQEDGSFVWANPAKDGKIPLIALEDIGHYSLWLFDNPAEAAGMNLKVATESVAFADIVKAFSEVTGKKGVHVFVPLEQYLPAAEPYPGAPSNWAVNDNTTLTPHQILTSLPN